MAAVCALSILVAACEGRSPLVPSPGESAPPAGGTFTLSGTVTDGVAPVVGARVEAMGQVNCAPPPPPNYGGEYDPAQCYQEQMLGSTNTDAGGAFTIGNLPGGYVTVHVSKDGAVVSEGVYLQSDSTVSLTLESNAQAGRPAARRRAGDR
jgi:hypothetical protein